MVTADQQVWYLLGWLAHLQNEFSVAVDCLRRCKEVNSLLGNNNHYKKATQDNHGFIDIPLTTHQIILCKYFFTLTSQMCQCIVMSTATQYWGR